MNSALSGFIVRGATIMSALSYTNSPVDKNHADIFFHLNITALYCVILPINPVHSFLAPGIE